MKNILVGARVRETKNALQSFFMPSFLHV